MWYLFQILLLSCLSFALYFDRTAPFPKVLWFYFSIIFFYKDSQISTKYTYRQNIALVVNVEPHSHYVEWPGWTLLASWTAQSRLQLPARHERSVSRCFRQWAFVCCFVQYQKLLNSEWSWAPQSLNLKMVPHKTYEKRTLINVLFYNSLRSKESV